MAISAAQWAQVRALFELLIDLPAQARAAQWAAWPECDPLVRAEVERMLDAAPSDETMACTPGLGPVRQAFDLDEPPLPDSIGSWRVKSQLGEGGMGTVFLVERFSQDVRQVAALKLLKGYAGSPQSLARFRAEQRMLAALHHPNIAHMIEAGLDERGIPFIAMEYVEGLSLLDHARQNKLGAAQRIHLFRQVCAAVDHAHQRLIVHRDLKPSNILVDVQGHIKLVDFGIGKLLSELDGATLLTQTGMRLFTLGYAAPEQLSGESVSTATDVFSLGVVLYELLTGRLPFALSSQRVVDWERQVHTTQPTPPSACWRQSVVKVDFAAAALPRALAPDIDAVVLKALRPEQAQRYQSVGEFSADLLSLLDGQPVGARRGSKRYRAAKFIRRHTLALGLGATAVVALGVGGVVALVQANEAQRQRDQAQIESKRANAVVDFMTQVFADADPGNSDGKTLSAREVLDKGRDEIPLRTDLDPATRTSLSIAIARAYRALGAKSEMLKLMETTLPLARASANPQVVSDALMQLSVALINNGRSEEALKTLNEATALVATMDASEGGERAHRIDYLSAVALSNLDRAKDALPRLERAYAHMLKSLGPLATKVLDAQGIYVSVLNALGRQREGVEITRASVAALANAPEFPLVKRGAVLQSHGLALLYANDLDAAVSILLQTLAIEEKLYGAGHVNSSTTLNNLAVVRKRQGRIEDGLALAERSLAIQLAAQSADTMSLMTERYNVATFAQTSKRYQRSRELVEEALALYAARGQPLGSLALNFRALRAQLMVIEGDAAGAKAELTLIEPHAHKPGIFSALERKRYEALREKMQMPPTRSAGSGP